MYTEKSIAKYLKQAKETEKRYLPMKAEEIQVVISKGNRKIGHTLNVSLAPIFTCANCKECKYFCYDIKACLQYPKNVLQARIKNTVLLRKSMEEYFNQIRKVIKRRRKNFFFRWHVSGDIVSEEYLSNMVKIAKEFPY